MKFKIILSIAIALLFFLMASGTALAGSDPIQIYTLEDLMNIGTPENLSGNYILMADIDVGAEETDDLKFVPIGTSEHSFRGTFNGNNHTISNITFSNNQMNHVGVFGYAGKPSVIYDLSLKNVDLIGNSGVGALVGRASVATIKNCSVINSDDYGIFGRDNVGGLIGVLGTSSVFDSYAATYVAGNSYVGGLVGSSTNSVVSDSNAVGNVKGTYYIGGLVGSLTNEFISGSSATGNIESFSESGGLVGFMEKSNVSECYATGDILIKNGGGYSGGLVGSMTLSTVSCSYATGYVKGYVYAGGLVGRVYDGSAVRDSFYIGAPSSDDSAFGFFITPDELKQISTFTTLKSDGGRVSKIWNISSEPDSGSVWYINEGIGYPQFFKNYAPPELSDLPDLPPSTVSPNDDGSSSGYGKAEIIDLEPTKPEPSISLPGPEIIEILDSLSVSEKPANSMVEPVGSIAEPVGSMDEETGSNGIGILLICLFVILACVLIITLRQR